MTSSEEELNQSKMEQKSEARRASGKEGCDGQKYGILDQIEKIRASDFAVYSELACFKPK